MSFDVGDDDRERRGDDAKARMISSAGDTSGLSRGDGSALELSTSFGQSFGWGFSGDSRGLRAGTNLSNADGCLRIVFATPRGVTSGDKDGDDGGGDPYVLRGVDGTLSLAADMFDVPGRLRADLGMRDGTAFFCVADS